jgi:multidrug efflux system membrane fusion protein
VQAGNLIKENADDPMLTIRQVAPIYVTFAVPEQYLAEVRLNSARSKLAVVALDPKNGSQLAVGELTFIDNAVDMTTGTVTFKGTFPNDDRALWPGAFVDVRLRLRVDAGVTVVPASAVTVGQRGTQVFVIKDNKAELRTVTVRRTVGDDTIIEKGVQAGEMVVTNGQSRLVPGAQVTIKPAIESSSNGSDAANANASKVSKPKSDIGG